MVSGKAVLIEVINERSAHSGEGFGSIFGKRVAFPLFDNLNNPSCKGGFGIFLMLEEGNTGDFEAGGKGASGDEMNGLLERNTAEDVLIIKLPRTCLERRKH